MEERLTPGQVKKEIYDRINNELATTGAANLRSLIYEKPWCTGGKGEDVDIIKLNKKSARL